MLDTLFILLAETTRFKREKYRSCLCLPVCAAPENHVGTFGLSLEQPTTHNFIRSDRWGVARRARGRGKKEGGMHIGRTTMAKLTHLGVGDETVLVVEGQAGRSIHQMFVRLLVSPARLRYLEGGAEDAGARGER